MPHDPLPIPFDTPAYWKCLNCFHNAPTHYYDSPSDGPSKCTIIARLDSTTTSILCNNQILHVPHSSLYPIIDGISG